MRKRIFTLFILALSIRSTAFAANDNVIRSWTINGQHHATVNGQEYASDAEAKQASMQPEINKAIAGGYAVSIDGVQYGSPAAVKDAQDRIAREAHYQQDVEASNRELAANTAAFKASAHAQLVKDLSSLPPGDQRREALLQQSRDFENMVDQHSAEWQNERRGQTGPLLTQQGTPVGLSGFDTPTPAPKTIVKEATVQASSADAATATQTATAPKPAPVAYKPVKALVSLEKASRGTQK